MALLPRPPPPPPELLLLLLPSSQNFGQVGGLLGLLLAGLVLAVLLIVVRLGMLTSTTLGMRCQLCSILFYDV